MDTHDDWNPTAEKVHAGHASLYVGTIDAASGLVAVTCTDDNAPTMGAARNLLFDGSLELPIFSVKFYDPDESICMTVPVRSKHIRVTIYATSAEEPSTLLVQVRPQVGSWL